jgi:putative transposase
MLKMFSMPQSFVKNYIHLVFSTKNRQPLLDEQVQPELYNYLGGICNGLDCKPIKVGGYTDHVHILCLLSKKIALVTLLEEMKVHSSKWIKTKGEMLRSFYWQNGYGAFSVNPAEVDVAIRYIENQKEHHKKRTFQDEYRSFLKKYGIEYDERYVWD